MVHRTLVGRLLNRTAGGPSSLRAPTVCAMRRLAGPFFVFAGVMHFVKPRLYERIMPPYVPAQRELVLAGGVAEIPGGLALRAPHDELRRAGAWWTVATMAAVFPANVH